MDSEIGCLTGMRPCTAFYFKDYSGSDALGMPQPEGIINGKTDWQAEITSGVQTARQECWGRGGGGGWWEGALGISSGWTDLRLPPKFRYC